ncbi:MAG: hypothetical protein CVU03_05465 [Bacteroidetes bacterium HGW-Bacteroidetes-2]|jgi:hypothetical protein|nr:MAG: hypothetical protein CVU03_05465 [Bacteroidetes bacterium HGW-Bacteroidetes-2]
MTIPKTLPAPSKPPHLSKEIQWLSGEGAGSWFLIVLENETYKITRYAADGTKECEGIFEMVNKLPFDIHQKYTFTHLSHCNKVSLLQNNTLIIFKRVS